jgi:mono/diheme cytochrome c family protein
MKLTVFVCLALCSIALAQPQPATPNQAGRGGRGAGGGGGGFGAAFPQHVQADQAVIDRGKAVYGIHCAFCHGSDARGGEGGPNLIRSQLVLNDQNGEIIAPVVQNGRPDAGMPRIDLNNAQVSDIAAFLHSYRVSGYDAVRNRPPTVLVGNAQTGQQAFGAKCGKCHSVTGDLKGFGGKFADPKQLQQSWLAPGGGGRFGGPAATNVPPTTVTVTLAGGKKMEGRLIRYDDFVVAFADANGDMHSFRRAGDTPKIEVHDPLEPHHQLLPTYTDKEIHDITAYLATVK